METYPTYTYPDSGNSSPRSREIDLENTPPSWEDSSSSALPSNHKVKFMVSYNGKIQPRSHDNFLSYVGGETKILAVDRGVKFNFIYSKLSSLASNSFDSEVGFTFKYQLPGEDLDALISVANDDDLENMMSEYDRMLKGSNKPARLRLFLFPPVRSSSATSLPRTAYSSVNSESARMDPDPDHPNRIIRSEVVSDVLDVVSPPPPLPVQAPVPVPVHNNVDYLFGLDKGPVHVNNVPVLKENELGSVHHQQIPVQGFQQFHLQQQLQNQLHLQQQQSAMFPSTNDENYADPYQKSSSPANVPGNNPANFPVPPGYWQQIDHHQQQQQQNFPPQQPPQQPPQLQHQQFHTQQQVYMMHAPPPAANTYHAPQMMRPNQGFYQQPVFHNIPAPETFPAVSAAAQVRPVGESTGYAPVAYDSATGRQVYYAAGPQGGVIAPPPFPGMTAVTTMEGGGEMRGSGEGKVVPKIVSSQASV